LTNFTIDTDIVNIQKFDQQELKKTNNILIIG
jgi:hypothetical protein